MTMVGKLNWSIFNCSKEKKIIKMAEIAKHKNLKY